MATEDDKAARVQKPSDFATYEDYLSSMVTDLDLFYLEDVCLSRKIVELGYTGNKEQHSLAHFLAAKAKFEAEKRLLSLVSGKCLLSAGKVYTSPILRAMQMREEAARTGKNSCIFYVRDRDTNGHEVSGYIDFNFRLTTEDLTTVFEEQKKFLPTPDDLSFYDWNTGQHKSSNTENYEVLNSTHSIHAMRLRNKRDNKIMTLDPALSSPGGGTSRTVVPETEYLSVIVFDHYNRRRT